MFTSIINSTDLATLLSSDNLVVIDCRFALGDTEQGKNAYNKSHIPTAFYAHLDNDLSGEIIAGTTGRHPLPTIKDFVKTVSNWGIEQNTQVVVYDDKGGAIAARLWWMLRWLGHNKVAVLDGGWQAWQKQQLPVSSEQSQSIPKVFVPKVRTELLVDVDVVEKQLSNPAFLLVDSRSPNRYRGEEEPIDAIAGHIPNAVSAPFAENFTTNKHLQPINQLVQRFQNLLKNHNAQQTIFYCGSGVTACYNLLALYHAGLGEGKLYAGSWSEWIVDDSREVIVEK